MHVLIEEVGADIEAVDNIVQVQVTISVGDSQDAVWNESVLDPNQPGSDDVERLEWYFEQRYRHPRTESSRAFAVVRQLKSYGEDLFNQIFKGHSDCRLRLEGNEQLRIDISGTYRIHRLHWELLKSPNANQPFAVTGHLIRRTRRPPPGPYISLLPEKKRLNILLVVARPFHSHDVGYRSIAKVLADAIRIEEPENGFNIDVLRPGTFIAFKNHLNEKVTAHGPGYYDIVHFDLHGIVAGEEGNSIPASLTLSSDAAVGREGQLAGNQRIAHLFFLGEDGGIDPVSATNLASVLKKFDIPLIIINSCQSSKELGSSEDSLARVLSESGCNFVVGMAYTITVTGAALFTRIFYDSLRQSRDPVNALLSSRQGMFREKSRQCAGVVIDFEDWNLPVAYMQSSGITDNGRYQQNTVDIEVSVAARYPQHEPVFFGRDIDILELEQRFLLRSNIIPLFGNAGVGKSRLLKFLEFWWRNTGFVENTYLFDFAHDLFNFDEFLDDVATTLPLVGLPGIGGGMALSKTQEESSLEKRIVTTFRSARYFLSFDSLEKTRSLDKREIVRLKRFLAKLEGGKSLVILSANIAGREVSVSSKYEAYEYHLKGLDEDASRELLTHAISKLSEEERHDFNLSKWTDTVNSFQGNPLAIKLFVGAWSLKNTTDASSLTPEMEAEDSLTQHLENFRDSLSDHDRFLLLALAPFGTHLVRSGLIRYGTILRRDVYPTLEPHRYGTLIERLQRYGLINLASTHLNGQILMIDAFMSESLKAWLDSQEPRSAQLLKATFMEHFVQESLQLLLLRSQSRADVIVLVLVQLEHIINSTKELVRRALDAQFHLGLIGWVLDTTGKSRKGSDIFYDIVELTKSYTDHTWSEPMSNNALSALHYSAVFSSSLSDHEKVEKYVEMFQAILEDHLTTRPLPGEECPAIKLADSRIFALLQGEMLILSGLSSIELGSGEVAKAKIRTAVRIQDAIRVEGDLGHFDSRGERLRHLARIALKSGDREEAETMLNEAITDLEKSWPAIQSHNLRSCLLELSELKVQKGEIDSALRLQERALKAISNDPKAALEQAKVYKTLGNSYFTADMPDKAERCYRTALDLLYQVVATDNSTLPLFIHATLQYDLAQILKKKGLIEEAKGVISEACTEFKTIGEQASEMRALSALVELNYLDGDFATVKETDLDLVKYYEKHPDVESYRRVLIMLAMTHLDCGERQLGISCLEKFLKIDLHEKHPAAILSRLFAKGLLAELQGEKGDALKFYEAAASYEDAQNQVAGDRGIHFKIRCAILHLQIGELGLALDKLKVSLPWTLCEAGDSEEQFCGKYIGFDLDIESLEKNTLPFVLFDQPYYCEGDASLNLAILYVDFCRWSEAIQLLRNCLNLYGEKTWSSTWPESTKLLRLSPANIEGNSGDVQSLCTCLLETMLRERRAAAMVKIE